MKPYLIAILGLLTSTVTVSAITVSAPANGATVGSPFTLVASTTTCSGVPAVSMGYSIDHNAATVEPTSFTASVVATPGAHVLHVKCWGKQVSSEALLNITVVAAASNITVASPANGANLTSPFTLSAKVTTCASTTAASMGYSIDGGHTTAEPTSFSASISANPGSHVLAVKCTGQNVADQVLLNIHVGLPPTAATPKFSLAAGTYSTKQVVTLSDATVGAKIYYTLDGSGPSTASPVYTGPIAVNTSLTIEALAVASGYSNSGLARADYTVSTSKGPTIPSNATQQTDVHLMSGWRIKHDPATPGTATGVMTVVADPSMSGQAQQFSTTFTNGGGELYSLTYANDSSSKNFVYDAQVWVDDGSQISNLEMDNNQVIPDGDTVIYAFQCSGNTNTWEYSSNVGTPSNPVVKWIKSSSPCKPSNWAPNSWHHVQISYSRDDAGNVTYHSAWLDGVESPINATVNSAFTLGWAAGTLVTNFQVDGVPNTDGSSTLFLDNLTIYRW